MRSSIIFFKFYGLYNENFQLNSWNSIFLRNYKTEAKYDTNIDLWFVKEKICTNKMYFAISLPRLSTKPFKNMRLIQIGTEWFKYRFILFSCAWFFKKKIMSSDYSYLVHMLFISTVVLFWWAFSYHQLILDILKLLPFCVCTLQSKQVFLKLVPSRTLEVHSGPNVH